jgi:large subunit ribosomal protein L3
MSISLVGIKCGMSRLFCSDGSSTPITVLKVFPNRIVQKKTVISDGYNALQVTFGIAKDKKVTKPLKGHYDKAGVSYGLGLWELRFSPLNSNFLSYNVGFSLDVSVFDSCKFVDVSGISKGRGFSGVIRRHNFSGQPKSHGNSLSHRVPGSTGQCQDPGRVFLGKKMPGHYGNERVTIKNLCVARVDKESNLILVKGSVPGFNSNFIFIKKSMEF